MKLKKLELYGFKSFADRTTFEFEDSLSALVGPNGSGKSNVVDAIKWVLGERSARKLRGTEMTNVIFDGSASRKPVNYAEVKLTIDNADGWLPVDYDEVCIGRRIDRTGQSEYSLNGRQVRLKDVRHLLLDTGVGADCYSVIEQGQIDQLLRASPKERRVVFEEAAGISRFLEQKREAERKLERVADNLARAGDLVEEIGRQLRSVKYQAGRARTFRKQVERLQRLRLAHAMHSGRELAARRADHAAAVERTLADRSRLAQDLAENEAALDAARQALQNAQTELSDSRQQLARAEARIESLAREAELNRRQQQEFHQRLHQLAERQNALEARLAELDDEVGAAAAELERAARELEERTSAFQVRQLEAEALRRDLRASEEGLEAAKSQVFDLFQHGAHLRNQIEVLAAERRALQHRLERIEGRQGELRGQMERVESERATAQERLEGLRARQAEASAQIARLKQSAEEARRRLETVVARLNEVRAELSEKVGRRHVLRDLEERAEGVRSGVQTLLGAGLPGMVGLMAQLLDVPIEHAAAVEAALGERVQAVVVQRAADAVEALRLLAREQAGRAELIVLEHLTEPVRGRLGPAPGLAGPLAGLVRCEAPAARAVERLLGGVYVAEDRERALALVRAGLPEGVTLVTPGGERYGADGLWAGGRPEGASLISRRSELAALEGQICGLESALAGLTAEREEAAGRLAQLQAQGAELASRAEQLGRNASETNSHLRAVSDRARELRDELRLARTEAEELGRDVVEIGARAGDFEAQAEQARGERAAAQKAAEDGQARLRALQERQQSLSAETNELAGELARTRERQRNLEGLVERLRTEGERLRSELAALGAEREAGARRRQEAEAAVESAQAEAADLEGERRKLSDVITSGSGLLQERRAKIEALAARSDEFAGQRAQLDEKVTELRMLENETAVRMQQALSRAAEDYGVRLEALEREPATWAEESPFVTKLIREFAGDLAQERPAGRVASWYRELEAGQDEPADDDAPEVISLDEACALRQGVLGLANDPATDWQRVKDEAAQLKARVDRIGNVNVAAIRQEEELEVRLQFLTDQREDLEKARRHQRDIIRELNKKSRERFRETFEQVRANFQALFRKLFGGGAADLILDEEEDILEAGIEIAARPPGKETCSISLLSGGEKALTTVALLFAMFQAKPSPFCLLDEVDAPLDDSNVERFLMLLDEFRRDTQFVLITHNKLSMTAAQVLYGLTMSDGVSRKIAVKFEEVDQRLAGRPAPRAKAG